ncbi:hypothetical protein [Herbiconiux sp. VKM Ac-2851]|uniref:hypothetical protein n=1 Tax=Herbiconiux sp. VKM Ac-2851 TaxID=2739025 RepID=UPI001565789F|nr:hypothetical protein [Herbiconiux sp. VKM Ac-2851]NQX36466.1 hypothetical protein [Herbiconiux sp. VKM Ac-2851]
MTVDPERRAELIAAAAASALTPSEAEELEGLRAVDPTIELEIEELRGVIEAVTGAVPRWDASAPSASLRDRVVGVGEEASPAALAAPVAGLPAGAPAGLPGGSGAARRSRRRWVMPAAAAAACLVLGFGVGVLAIPRGPAEAPLGAPGELGAREVVDFAGEPSGVSVDGSVVAHTWGTETILEISGLAVGESYQLVVVDAEGRAESSGSFVGSTATIDCRMNAATLRSDAASIEIRDAAGGTVAAAVLPPAQS